VVLQLVYICLGPLPIRGHSLVVFEGGVSVMYLYEQYLTVSFCDDGDSFCCVELKL
jgi:hypothetical protein